jgi:solute carrier family 25 carnitine/acylcarnitine transporter 20/29
MFEFLAAGFASGVSAVLIGHPFDTVKVLFQSKTPVRYSPRILYAGISGPLITVAPMFAISYGLYGSLLEKYPNSEGTCGGIAGFAYSFLSTPMEMVKIHAQVKNKSFVSAARNMYAESKSLGVFYRGYRATLLRELTSFPIFYKLNGYLRDQGCPSWLGGGVTGIVMWTAVMPLDTIKTHVQVHNVSISDAVKALRKSRGFFRGYAPVMLRAFPVNAVSYSVYHQVADHFNEE